MAQSLIDYIASDGEKFNNIGCASCHRPGYKTPDSFETANEFGNQMIWPCSDMLLHDMGEDLAKSVHPDIGFLHDGRAKTIQEAILWHDGEAGTSREKYQKLSPADRHSILSGGLSTQFPPDKGGRGVRKDECWVFAQSRRQESSQIALMNTKKGGI